MDKHAQRADCDNRGAGEILASQVDRHRNIGDRKIKRHRETRLRFAGVLSSVRMPGAVMAEGLWLGLLAVSLASPQAAAAEEASPMADASGPSPSHQGAPAAAPESLSLLEQQPRSANFRGETASRGTRRVADWVVDSGDNRSLPFMIVDKVNAKVFVFDGQGQLRGAAPALLGLARGDDTAAGIGQRRLAAISPEERTTPAGRFVAALGHDFVQDILWLDYDAALSLHRVVAGNRDDRRYQRLASASPLDNRISYGCINVPVTFYDNVVVPAFTGTVGIVYILPETRPIEEVFAIPHGEAHSQR